MRKITLLIILMIPIFASGQSSNNPKIYLNSQIISIDSVFINPKNIESINTQRDNEGGQIYIKTKDQTWKSKTIEELLKTTPVYSQIFLDKSIIPIFFIDEKLINKETDAKIDNSYFAVVTLKKLSAVKNIDAICKNIIIVDIKLTDTIPKQKIYIRGNTSKDIEDYLKMK